MLPCASKVYRWPGSHSRITLGFFFNLFLLPLGFLLLEHTSGGFPLIFTWCFRNNSHTILQMLEQQWQFRWDMSKLWVRSSREVGRLPSWQILCTPQLHISQSVPSSGHTTVHLTQPDRDHFLSRDAMGRFFAGNSPNSARLTQPSIPYRNCR